MEGAVDFIFMSILLYIGLFFVKGRWLYKDGGYSLKKIVIIEIISFILQELFLLWLVFNGGGELNSSTYLEDETSLGKIKKTILMLYD